MPRYLRRELDERESLSAAAVAVALAAGVGAIAFYVTRLLLSREAVTEPTRGSKSVATHPESGKSIAAAATGGSGGVDAEESTRARRR